MEPLIGRETELATLGAGLSAALAGDGRLMLVSGEPGIGKTRLVDAAAEHAQRAGATIRRGYAIDDPGVPALWPWLRMVRDWPRAESALRTAPDPANDGARFAMFDRFTRVLASEAAADGLVLVLEDLHWADRTSLLLLRHVVGEIGAQRILVLATYREHRDTALSELLSDLVRPAATRRVHLSGLTEAAVIAWLHGALPRADPSLASRLHERTSGNPLLIRMMLDAAPDTEPATWERLDAGDGLRDVVATWTANLPTDAGRVVAAASVLGERIEPPLLARVVGLSPDALRTALVTSQEAGVLRTDPASGRLLFAHALVRDAVYAELDPATRSDLHRACTHALETAHGTRAAGLIAMHWRRYAGTDGPANCLSWARIAAKHAGDGFGYDEAVRFRELAIEVANEIGCGDDELATLQLELAEAAFAASRIDASVDACVLAAEYADRAGRADIVAAAGLVVHGFGTGVQQSIRSICERALVLIGDDDPVVRARLLAQVAHAAAEDQAGPDAASMAASALEAADSTGDSTAVLEAIAARHLAISIPQTVDERLRLGRRAVDLGRSSRAPMAAVWGHIWRVDAAFQLGNLDEVGRELEAVDRIARVLHSPVARWHHERLLATRAALVGDFPGARERNAGARAVAERFGQLSMTALYAAFAAQLAIVRGDPAEYPPGFEDQLRSFPPLPLVRINVPILLAMRGELDAARAAFEEFRTLPRSMPVGPRWWPTLWHVAVVAVLVDDTEVAADLYPLLEPLSSYYSCDGSGAVFCHGSAARAAGDLALLTGSYDSAVRHYADGVRMNARIGARPFTALSRLGQATALYHRSNGASGASSGDLASAIGLVQNATAEFGQLDMPGPLSAARALRERLSSSLSSALSRRENEVAMLVAEALSNREIADRLYLSERTVETHVRNILSKLGFGSRTQIATWSVARQSGRR
ncbi:MAG: AAA family ATPase [Nocardioidaceae bacterium]